MSNEYDVIIVGTGPAGIFVALELIEKGKNLKVLMLDSGNDPRTRIENRLKGKIEIMQGWGGAGAFSDGKLTLTSDIGGYLSDYIPLTTLESYIKEVENLYVKFGASRKRLVTGEGEEVQKIRKNALKYGIRIIPYRLLHIGTDKCAEVLTAMYDYILASKIVEIHFNETVSELIVENNSVSGVITKKQSYFGKYVIIATGRSGAAWMRKEALRIGLSVESNPVDIGVRVEIPAEIGAHLTDVLYEFKAKYYSPTFEQECRTFCVCPKGFVTKEIVYDSDINEQWITVNGHSYSNKQKETNNTNFALLVSSKFTEPFDDPLAYGRSISKLANLLTGGKSVIIQRLSDLKRGRRSNHERLKRSSIEPTFKEAVPGDLSFVLPYRHLQSILEMLEALDHILPGVNSDVLLYGVETKYYSSKIKLSDELETEISGLYAIGDGAGITRSLAQASASGLIASRSILNKLS